MRILSVQIRVCLSTTIVISLLSQSVFANCPIPYKMKSNESVSEVIYRSVGSPVYGRKGYLRKVAKLNTKIKNINRVYPGTSVCFPFEVRSEAEMSEPAISQPPISQQVQPSQAKPIQPDDIQKPETQKTEIEDNVELADSSDTSASPRSMKLGLGIGAYALSYTAQSPVSDADFSSSKIPSLHMYLDYETTEWNAGGLFNYLPTDLPQNDGSKKAIGEIEFGGSIGYNVSRHLSLPNQLRIDWTGQLLSAQQPHLNYSTNQTIANSSLSFLRGLTGLRFKYALSQIWNIEMAPEIQWLTISASQTPSKFKDSDMWQVTARSQWQWTDQWSYQIDYRYRDESLKLDQSLNGIDEEIKVARPSHLFFISLNYHLF